MKPKLSDYQQRMRQFTASNPVEWKPGEREALIAEAVERGRVNRFNYSGAGIRTFEMLECGDFAQNVAKSSPFFQSVQYRDVVRSGNVSSV